MKHENVIRRYRQVFSNNMSTKGKPEIKSCKASENWTSVSFCPDLAKFGMEELEEDTVALMRKRVYDMAGVLGKGVKVSPSSVALGKREHEVAVG
jgi:DNA topoisomerase-2